MVVGRWSLALVRQSSVVGRQQLFKIGLRMRKKATSAAEAAFTFCTLSGRLKSCPSQVLAATILLEPKSCFAIYGAHLAHVQFWISDRDP
jgi:hypothetical protein